MTPKARFLKNIFAAMNTATAEGVSMEAMGDLMADMLADMRDLCDDSQWPDEPPKTMAEARAQLDARIRELEAEIEALREGRGEPVAYRYRYTDPISGTPVWRMSGGEWNNQQPREVHPLYASPAPERED